MAKKYLDYDGLAYFWEKVKTKLTGKLNDINYDTTNHKLYKTKEGTNTDIVSVSTLKTDMALTKADVGLGNVTDGAQVNVLEGIQKNGTTVTITNKIANISVPTATSELTNDSGFITSHDIPPGAAASTTTPKMDGTATVGTELAFARGDHIHPTDTSRAPVSHAASTTTYGAGTNTNYGHVKLSDATDGTSAAASGGTAATPKAVKDALDAAKAYADGLDTGVSDVQVDSTSIVSNGIAALTTGDVNDIENSTTNSQLWSGSTLNGGIVNLIGSTLMQVVGQPDGLAGLDSEGKVPNELLYIDTALSSTSTNAVQNKVINTALGLKAPLASPALTGTPTAPTAAVATDSTQIATTAFVHDVVDALDTGVSDVKVGTTSVVSSGVATIPAATSSTLGAVKVTNGNGLIISSGTISMALATASTAGAMSATDKNAIGVLETSATANYVLTATTNGPAWAALPTASASTPGITKLYTSTGSSTDGTMDRNSITTALNAKAPLASPALTGTPTAPTATAGTNTTQIATTAFVTSAIQTAQTGAATFQGTAPTTFAPTNYKTGYYWVVGTAGTYAGEACEPGDMIFAVADYDSAYQAADFNVIQTNLDITSITNAEIDTIMAA